MDKCDGGQIYFCYVCDRKLQDWLCGTKLNIEEDIQIGMQSFSNGKIGFVLW